MKQHGQQQQLSAFELQRQQRIAENKAKMMEIGVDDARDQLLATQQAEKQAKTASKPKPQRKAKPAEPARRSERNAGKERPNYRGQQELAVFVERQARLRAPKRDRKPGKEWDGSSRYPSWHMGIPDAPMPAIEDAFAAASELAEQLTDDGTPAYVKTMTDSMVARGGWLQAPRELQQHYCADSDITFTTPDRTRPASDFRYTQSHRREGEGRADAWTVGFLQKKNLKTGIPQGGYGFSKNWKGFAADQFLHPGDSVVIQVTGPFEAVLHIFRAWDYAPEASKPEGFDAIRFSRAAVVATSGDDANAAAGEQQRGAAAAAADEEEEEEGSEEEGEEEEAGSAAGDDSSEQADDTAGQHKPAGGRSRASSSALKSKQQAAAAAAAGAGKAGKRKAADTAASTAAGSGKRQRSAGGNSSKGTKRRQEEPAAATNADAAPSKRGSKKHEQQKPAKPKQHQQGQQKQQQKKTQQQQQQQGEQEEDFAVDWILGTKVISGVRVFKVRWLGYGAAYDTWEPAEMFGGDALSYDWGQLQKNGNIKRINAPKSLAY